MDACGSEVDWVSSVFPLDLLHQPFYEGDLPADVAV